MPPPGVCLNETASSWSTSGRWRSSPTTIRWRSTGSRAAADSLDSRQRNSYITTPINYVNGAPPPGHAYEAIATDVLARHMRQRDPEVFFLTGTDEHGEPVADAAKAQGLEPQALADQNAARLKQMDAALNISNDS